jgi:putative endopeptidase
MIKINNDFYNYINSFWISNNPIPDDKSRWSHFDILEKETDKKLMQYLNQSTNQNLNQSTNQNLNQSTNQNLNILWNKGNDLNDDIENTDLQIINNILQKIDNVKTTYDLGILYIDLIEQFNIKGPLLFNISPELSNSSINILWIYTDGLSLPEREYYFKEMYKKEREEFKKFIKEYTDLFNFNLSDKQVGILYKIEEILAEKTYSSSEEREPNLINNIRTIEQIEQDYNNLNWLHYIFNKHNITSNKICITNPKFFKHLNEIFNEYFLDSLKLYIKFKFISSINSYASLNTNNCWLNFYEKILGGVKSLKPLKKRVLSNIDKKIGQELGMLWIKNNFNDKIIDDIQLMFNYIKNTIHEALLENKWLTQNTKKKAIDKLLAITIKIGYPNNNGLYDYSNLKLFDNYTYLQCNIELNIYNTKLEINKLYKKVNKDEWHMSAHNINAYYSPQINEIVIPAGILQEPFYNIDTNNIGSNYGGIGMIIGHEIIHGFDDKGRLYDQYGNLNNWWSEDDIKYYNEQVDKLKAQYNKYNVNTSLTIGETIADLGGVNFSLNALEKYLIYTNKLNKEYFKHFFINFAYCWANNIREEYLKQKKANDPHPEPSLRVNGILQNINKFYEIFDITSKYNLSPEERVNIW